MKVIVLLSGGLDSTLAVRLLKEQGVDLVALNFKTPFCLCDRKTPGGCGSFSRRIVDSLGIKFKIVNVVEDFFVILKAPLHGFGANMNPCIDCRILLFKKAKELMQEEKAAFIATGEVLGQRPMSQHKSALKLIEKEAGLEGLVLRPLSAKLLPETIPEKEGWIDRNKLLDFSGRSRKPHMALAKRFNIKDYPCPAGGCLLTDPQFAKKIKDLLTYDELSLNEVELLKVGRHFRLSKEAKLVVGRNEQENGRLLNLARENDYLFHPLDMVGPTALGRGIFNDEIIRLSSSIICHYSDLNGKGGAKIIYRRIPYEGVSSQGGGCPLYTAQVEEVSAIKEDKLEGYRI